MANDQAHVLRFERPPSVVAGYLRAALSRAPGLGVDGIPRIEARLAGVRPDAVQVRRYAELCGYSPAPTLPATFPHVLAAPLHLAVLTHKAFPLKLVGAVHVRNAVRQRRPLQLDERLDVAVQVQGHREVEQGIEFDLVTTVLDGKGQCPWSSVSTNLVRMRRGGPRKPAARAADDLSGYEPVARWTLDAGLGRRYGWLAGDINPIHLSALSAKPFGFPRAIAHGMWTFARCNAELLKEKPAAAAAMQVAFKRPVLLPGEVVLRRRRHGAHADYVLTDASGETVFVAGSVGPPQE